jgi:hypothetical protein
MFRALGVILVLWYLSHAFTESFHAFDRALRATFETLEAAAIASRESME